jgi:hypothetical protein
MFFDEDLEAAKTAIDKELENGSKELVVVVCSMFYEIDCSGAIEEESGCLVIKQVCIINRLLSWNIMLVFVLISYCYSCLM